MSMQDLRAPHASGQPGEPAYLRIKRYVLDQVARGAWREGDRVPSEAELVQLFRVSRMTAHRALRELTSERDLRRVQGVGTFVAAHKSASTLITIHGIQDEIRARGHLHACDVLALERVPLSKAGVPLALPPGTMLYRSLLLHRENGIPIQVEDRYVNPAVAPKYLQQDFARITPNQYLVSVAPHWRAEYAVEAVAADRRTARLLGIGVGAPCLVLIRHTWSRKLPASFARLTHPGERHRFTGQV